ncbi:serine hydrolase domain-containing protein [Enterococcus columbae]|uniref:Beta-lactamase-related domain-containing protein n=1 Tax=Enterococcus columbae DSM 7374 = ATCC 51263 TaxID=1121865 RepID=S0JZ18_9ENTE|nr:serine hydrolase domain-containing protein [Enterococcus columbae]EOT38109.1 hypothetical protein OMW_02367 [Enterococcus columbae DSM 7374 = ATCC 51263]EOW83776.1 hypothetical protein I568_01578 [Enterococcus columbae DSM 7374 = ATCC 51263]OJG24807.1 hypothetical protein RR47_GL002163 [Enterococcus columbae DSM 7374 = ATCC 51263]
MYTKTRQTIHQFLKQGVFSGVNYWLFDQGKIISESIGQMAVLPKTEPMDEQALFDVASLTKVVCTTSVLLKLYEQGQLDFDRPLKSYLPTFQDERITIRHLLTHTADIQTYIPNRDQLTAEQLRAAYLTMQAGQQLGQVVKYTDAGTILLGFMLEEIYQQPVTTIFKQVVLTPLSMQASGFPPKLSNLPIVPTEQLASGEILRGMTHDPKARVLGNHAGNAGLFTNMDDLIRFCKMYLDFGGNYLQESTVRMLLQDQTPTGSGGRSLGWDLKGASEQAFLFHTGYTGTFLAIDPLAQQAFLFLSNRVHPVDHRQAYINKRDELLAIYQQEKTQNS